MDMKSNTLPDFNDTRTAFAWRSNLELIRTYQVFRLINLSWLVKFGTSMTTKLLDAGIRLPVVMAMRPTVYSIFCGGKSVEDANGTIRDLYKFGVETILDYGVEGKDNEADFERTATEVMRAIDAAANDPAVNHISSKFTGLIGTHILEKLHKGEALSEAEKAEYIRAHDRIEKICAHAALHKVRLFVDAEESWIQQALDDLVEEMQKKFNKEQVIIFGTAQLYLKGRISYLTEAIEKAKTGGYLFAAKLVRGAYMEKERERSKAMGYPDPIQPDKAATDLDYDKAVEIALENISQMAVCIATHNESSCLKAVALMQQKNISPSNSHVSFSQLLGMSDHISFNLAAAGYKVSKYMPYGPVTDVIPYLVRRAQENTSVSGQMGRELSLLKIEIRRRKILIP